MPPTTTSERWACRTTSAVEFQYSLDVKQGHGNRAIEDFLERRTGYCEQFAGTFAAMARHLGMPARVAVGYTPGTLGEEGQYSVAGRNAHAWPEVWFDGLGWVPFEPTPGRGAPGTEQYTGVSPEQAEPGPGGPTTPPPSASPRVRPRDRSRFHRSPTLVYRVEARRATASRPRRAACLPSPAAPEAAASPRR